MNRHRKSFAGYGGVTLAGDVVGNPSAPSVILQHGGGQTRHSWGGGLTALANAGYHVIALDLRGHGDSSWAENGDYSLESMTADIRAVAATCTTPPVLVGASMGGILSMLALGDEPSLACALVLVDVAPRLEMAGIDRIHAFMSGNSDGFDTLEDAADAIASYSGKPRRVSAGLAKNLRRREDGRWRWHWDPAFMNRDLGTSIAYMGQQTQRAASLIEIPTLLLRGALSDVVALGGADDLASRISQLEYFEVADAAHMIAGDSNDAFNAAIINFLARHVPVDA